MSSSEYRQERVVCRSRSSQDRPLSSSTASTRKLSPRSRCCFVLLATMLGSPFSELEIDEGRGLVFRAVDPEHRHHRDAPQVDQPLGRQRKAHQPLAQIPLLGDHVHRDEQPHRQQAHHTVRQRETQRRQREGAFGPAGADTKQDGPRLGNTLGPEKHPGDVHQHKGAQTGSGGRQQAARGLQPPGIGLVPEGLHHLKQPVQRAPHHKGGGSAVPQAADQKHDHHVQAGAGGAPAGAAQRDVQIILEPGGQRNVPPAPELLDGAGQIGRVEVLHQPVTQHLRRADGDVGIGGEVAVDLERERHRGHRQRAARGSLVFAVHMVHDHRHPVRNHNLLEQAPAHEQQALLHPVVIKAVPLVELGQQIGGPLDGARHQLGEKADKQRISEGVALGLQIAPVHVDGIAQRLKSVKADAHRQREAERGQQQMPGAGRFQHSGEKAVILEGEQHRKVGQQHPRQRESGKGRPFLPPALDEQ